MTDKEIARFKVKFPKINLSKQRLDDLKLNLADDADEATIDAKLDEVNGYIPYEAMAKEDDRLRQPPKPAPAPKPAPVNEPAPADLPAPDDSTPAWAKTLIEQNKTLSEKVNALETGKTVDSRKTQLEAALKDVPDSIRNKILKDFNRMSFKDDEEYTGFLDETKTDVAALVQAQADAGLASQSAPLQSTPQAPEKKVSTDIANWAKATSTAPPAAATK